MAPYDVAAADVISMADHPRTCGTPNCRLSSLTKSRFQFKSQMESSMLFISPSTPPAALNTQMVWVQTEDNGSEFYAHVLSNYPWWCRSFQNRQKRFKILMQNLQEVDFWKLSEFCNKADNPKVPLPPSLSSRTHLPAPIKRRMPRLMDAEERAKECQCHRRPNQLCPHCNLSTD